MQIALCSFSSVLEFKNLKTSTRWWNHLQITMAPVLVSEPTGTIITPTSYLLHYFVAVMDATHQLVENIQGLDDNNKQQRGEGWRAGWQQEGGQLCGDEEENV